MAAASLKGRALAGSLRKPLLALNLIGTSGARVPPSLAAPPASASFKRGVHASSYDKNVDDQVRPTVVPDYVIDLESDKYWGPHPETGVFGPTAAGGETGGAVKPTGGNGGGAAGGGATVLDQTVWFRPLEDVDKPPHD